MNREEIKKNIYPNLYKRGRSILEYIENISFIFYIFSRLCSSGKLLSDFVRRSRSRARFLRYLLVVGKREQYKGPVIRDEVRPVPRLASRTITLRELESLRTGLPIEGRERERARKTTASLFPFPHLSLFSRSSLRWSLRWSSYFENRMITRLRSRFPATCSRSGRVEDEYILLVEGFFLLLSRVERRHSLERSSLAWAISGQGRQRRFKDEEGESEPQRGKLLLYTRRLCLWEEKNQYARTHTHICIQISLCNCVGTIVKGTAMRVVRAKRSGFG